MRLIQRYLHWCALFSLSQITLSWSSTEGAFSVEHYLNQIKENNPSVKGNIISSKAAEQRSIEGELLLAPTLNSNYTFSSDSKLPTFSFLSYNKIVTNTLSVGVSKLTTFGLQAKLNYVLTDTRMLNPASAIIGLNIPLSYANASPVLELTQSLWGNSFGSSTRATQSLLRAQALTASYNSSYQAKVALSQGEAAYWRLATARQLIQIQTEAIDRAKQIYEWNKRRVNLHLADETDLLQAEAQVQRTELELINSRNEERAASRAFNSSRNINSDQVEETLQTLDQAFIEEISAPKKALLRDDVKAALESSNISRANAIISTERDKPTFELFASAALNGQTGTLPPTDLSDSIGKAFTFDRPTYTLGFRLIAPLTFGTASQVRDAWKQEQVATELVYERKLFDQEQSWKDLTESLSDSKRRLELSSKLEGLQKRKLLNEKDRLQRGRTTTYQVLVFETDYLMALLSRIRDQASVLNIISQMKTFGESL